MVLGQVRRVPLALHKVLVDFAVNDVHAVSGLEHLLPVLERLIPLDEVFGGEDALLEPRERPAPYHLQEERLLGELRLLFVVDGPVARAPVVEEDVLPPPLLHVRERVPDAGEGPAAGAEGGARVVHHGAPAIPSRACWGISVVHMHF